MGVAQGTKSPDVPQMVVGIVTIVPRDVFGTLDAAGGVVEFHPLHEGLLQDRRPLASADPGRPDRCGERNGCVVARVRQGIRVVPRDHLSTGKASSLNALGPCPQVVTDVADVLLDRPASGRAAPFTGRPRSRLSEAVGKLFDKCDRVDRRQLNSHSRHGSPYRAAPQSSTESESTRSRRLLPAHQLPSLPVAHRSETPVIQTPRPWFSRAGLRRRTHPGARPGRARPL